MSCRAGLLRLHRLGFIELPPPLTKNGNGKGLVRQKAKLPQLSFLEADLQSLTGLRLDRVRTREESAYWNGLIDEYHYLGYKPLPGAQVRYLIRWDGGDSGAIGFSAAACKGWDEAFGAYRFFNNGKVTEQKVLSAHRDATRKRILGRPGVLA